MLCLYNMLVLEFNRATQHEMLKCTLRTQQADGDCEKCNTQHADDGNDNGEVKNNNQPKPISLKKKRKQRHKTGGYNGEYYYCSIPNQTGKNGDCLGKTTGIRKKRPDD